ncbi:MAG: molybdenum cofactor synthesis domain-containing protein [Candidatus Peribacteraceae bacterium]
MSSFTIVSINISARKGEKKRPVPSVELREKMGIVGDAHAGFAHRQVSLLAMESIEKMRAKGLAVGPGDFAENITTEGIDLISLPVGARLCLGPDVEVEITQIGKECHSRCEIYRQAGDCVMPREGVFARVLRGGMLRAGDSGKVAVLPLCKGEMEGVDLDLPPLPPPRLPAGGQAYKGGESVKNNKAINIAIITVSDRASASIYNDESGPAAKEVLLKILKDHGPKFELTIIPDEPAKLRATLNNYIKQKFDFIFTTGGTGISPRDTTPEVTREVIDKEVPGIAEAMRAFSIGITKNAMLSRATAGVAGKTLIINLPGSPKAVKEIVVFLGGILTHAHAMMHGIDSH